MLITLGISLHLQYFLSAKKKAKIHIKLVRNSNLYFIHYIKKWKLPICLLIAKYHFYYFLTNQSHGMSRHYRRV